MTVQTISQNRSTTQNQSSTMTRNSLSFLRTTGIILLVEAFLIFPPLIILGSAINWPASLGEPAQIVLPLIHQQAGAVQLGYFIYMIYSVLFWPVSLLVVQVVAGSDTYSATLRLAAGFGLASAVLRTLGIIRWLFPMPILATLYVNPATSPQTQESIAIVYQMLNAYAGSVGEVLGVGFFAALWLTLVSFAILRSNVLPRWLGSFGLVAALGLFSSTLEMFGIDLGPFISVIVTALHLWFMAMGILLLRQKRAS